MRKDSKTTGAGKEPGKRLLRLRVNGEIKEVAAETSKTLLEVLREDLGPTGTKHGCDRGGRGRGGEGGASVGQRGFGLLVSQAHGQSLY
jgi:hypothetical protein